jgi:hypothetical protein
VKLVPVPHESQFFRDCLARLAEVVGDLIAVLRRAGGHGDLLTTGKARERGTEVLSVVGVRRNPCLPSVAHPIEVHWS